MTIILALVAVGWVLYLGFWLKDRMGTRQADSVHSFRSQLTTLERRVGPGRRNTALPFGGSGMASVPAHLRTRRVPARVSAQQAAARKRRRDVFLTLAGLFVFSLLMLAVSPGVLTGGLAFVLAVALAGYVFLLVQAERLAAERRTKVTYLEPRRNAVNGLAHGGSDYLLRRSATN